MELKDNILEAIGNTPLVRLNRVTRELPGELYAKCEFMNPGGSIKDRIGWYMVEQAEKAGKIQPGGTLIEGTSGNTGFGLALAAAIKGYKLIFTMPDKMSEEKRANLRAFGAKVIVTPTAVPADHPDSYYSVAARLAKEIPNSYYFNQYDNLTNRETHYHNTGPELWKQTEGKIDTVVMGMGTCGTISGIGRFLKEKNKEIRVIGVDPRGSILKDLFDTGKMVEAHTYVLEGIGEDIVPKNLDMDVIDEIIRIDDKESFLMTRTLLTSEGIFSGMSSGAAVVGALRYMAKTDNPGRVVVVLPDSGNRYLTKVYNDAWMIENGYMDMKAETRVSTMVRVLNKTEKVVTANKEDSIGEVVKIMRERGISQLPVMESSGVCGVITETDLLRPLFDGTVKPENAIGPFIDNNYAIVQEIDDIERLKNIFTSGKIAIVTSGTAVKHVLTKIDLIAFLSLQTGGA